ncbi:hypothetical protein A3K73_07280 [Candidatus Pacearchaeota archaeon RBG_13_36_9]|nr:MAG: hypothetical protein A3K73_07280 [Candidatus Pacearchaeota archaeon RBG_13_36_9]HJX50878.1 winged helix-turn-helix transcriptional regulator [Candidatus Nanoarchaeia archaeon]
MPKKKNLIDLKDRKILAELDNNSRQTDSEIAKKVGLSKQVVNYRIQNLISKEIISNFYTIVNISKFGLDFYYIFIQLSNINKEQEKKLAEEIEKLDYVGWLVSGVGRWDFVVGVNANSVLAFEKYLSQLTNLCGKHLHEYIFTTLVSAEHLSYKFLPSKEIAYGVRQGEKKEAISLSEDDKKILKAISQNARLPITEISKKTNLPIHTISYHLKNLVKSEVIEGFKPKIDIGRLGYEWHLLLIQLQSASDRRKKEFLEFCKYHQNIYYVTNTIGLYNVMLDIHVNNMQEFKEVLLDIKEKFSDIVKLYESIIIFEEHKIDYLPKSLI